ncbi:hypothetical protein BDW69DRAFT_203945 [Aspergillus filifer]
MYAPVRPRAKKTNIVRSRSGCKSCRERRTKCDEQKPTCGRWVRLGRRCEPVRLEFKFRTVNGPAPEDISAPVASRTFNSTPTEVRHQEHVHNFQLPGLEIVHSLQHSEPDTTALARQDKMLRDAILALSSCNLSRISSENRAPSGLDVATFSPNLVHQTRSQLYYSSAIRKFASLNQFDLRFRAEMVFTVLVIFAYIESSMKTSRGSSVTCMAQWNFVTLKALLSAWMQVRFVVWWARAYFSAIDVHRNLPSIKSTQERRVMVLTILCESHRLNSQEVLGHWSPVVRQEEAMFRDNQPYSSVELGTPFQRLTEQERKLDEWLLRLPPSEQPMFIDSDPGFPSQAPSIFNQFSAPLRFQTHNAALNFAYYIVAQIMQCTGFLEQGQTPHPDRNSYTIGFSGLMLAAVLRCQNASLGAEIQSWLEELKSLQPTEEGAFPVYQTLAVVRAINRRREIGREVFGVTSPTDDAGGTPKFTAYNSQTIRAMP